MCKCFLLVCGIYFHSLNSVFQRADVFNFDDIHFTSFLCINYAFDVLWFSFCLALGHTGFSPMFSCNIFWFQILQLVLQSMLRSFLYMVRDGSKKIFFFRVDSFSYITLKIHWASWTWELPFQQFWKKF